MFVNSWRAVIMVNLPKNHFGFRTGTVYEPFSRRTVEGRGGGREEIAQRLYFQRKAFLFITNYGGFFRVDIFQI